LKLHHFTNIIIDIYEERQDAAAHRREQEDAFMSGQSLSLKRVVES
jgi:hypothetical protein